MVESFRLSLTRESPEMSLAQATGNEPQGSLLDQLDKRIKDHERNEGDRGLIQRGLSTVYRSDENSLAELKKLREEAQKVKDDPAALAKLHIEDAIKKDQSAAHWQDEISHYGSSFIKAVPLFMTKGRGVALSGVLHGVDQVRTSTSVPLMAVDFTLGFGKGVALKKGLEAFGASKAPMWQKGLALGGGMSFVDSTLTTSTWYDHHSGKFHLGEGATKTGLGTVMGAGTGAVVFPVGHKIFERLGASKFAGDAMQKSPLLQNLANGWSFGLASGTTGETIRQIQAGESIDPLKIAGRGLLQSFVDMGAAGTGHKLSYAMGESGRTKFEWSKPQDKAEGTQQREFQVVGGERALTKALEKVDGEGAMVKVRERLGQGTGIGRFLGRQTFSEPVEMFIQKRNPGTDLNPQGARARLLAACGLDASNPNAVMTGKDVYMQVGKDQLRFTTEKPGSGQVVHLGTESVQLPRLGQRLNIESPELAGEDVFFATRIGESGEAVVRVGKPPKTHEAKRVRQTATDKTLSKMAGEEIGPADGTQDGMLYRKNNGDLFVVTPHEKEGHHWVRPATEFRTVPLELVAKPVEPATVREPESLASPELKLEAGQQPADFKTGEATWNNAGKPETVEITSYAGVETGTGRHYGLTKDGRKVPLDEIAFPKASEEAPVRIEETAALEPPPEFKQGQATWKSKDFDYPVEVEAYLGKSPEGEHYVRIKGGTGVPLKEIVYPKETAVDVEAARLIQEAERPQIEFNVEHPDADFAAAYTQRLRTGIDLAIDASVGKAGAEAKLAEFAKENGDLLRTINDLTSPHPKVAEAVRKAYGVEQVERIESPGERTAETAVERPDIQFNVDHPDAAFAAQYTQRLRTGLDLAIDVAVGKAGADAQLAEFAKQNGDLLQTMDSLAAPHPKVQEAIRRAFQVQQTDRVVEQTERPAGDDREAVQFKLENLTPAERGAITQEKVQQAIDLAMNASKGVQGGEDAFRQFAEQNPLLMRPLEIVMAKRPDLVEAMHRAYNVFNLDPTTLQSIGRLRGALETRIEAQKRAAAQDQPYRNDEPDLLLRLRQEMLALKATGGDVETFISDFSRYAKRKGEANPEDLMALLREASLPSEGITLPGEEPRLEVRIPMLAGEQPQAYQARLADMGARWQQFLDIVHPDRLPQNTYDYLQFRRQIFQWLTNNPDLTNVAIAFGQRTRDSQVAGPIEFFFYNYRPGGAGTPPVRLLDRFPGVPKDDGTMPKPPRTEAENGEIRQTGTGETGDAVQPTHQTGTGRRGSATEVDIEAAVNMMWHGSAKEQVKGAQQARFDVGQLTVEEFARWRQIATSNIDAMRFGPNGQVLLRADVAKLPNEVLQAFLAAPEPGAPSKGNLNLGHERLKLLGDVLDAFKADGVPAERVGELGHKLLNLGVKDRVSLVEVFDSIANQKIPEHVRDLNRKLLQHLVENAENIGDIREVFDSVRKAREASRPPRPPRFGGRDQQQQQPQAQPDPKAVERLMDQALDAAERTNPTDRDAVIKIIQDLISGSPPPDGQGGGRQGGGGRPGGGGGRFQQNRGGGRP